MSRRQPDELGNRPAEAVQARVQVRYAKRGRLRFSSHRDFARAFERALRRAHVPVAHSGGYSPRPRVSYQGAAPTGVASEAEYLEVGLTRSVDTDELRQSLAAALPEGLTVLEVVPARDGKLADRLTGSRWRIELAEVRPDALRAALTRFLAADEVLTSRVTKSGRKEVDVRAAVVAAEVVDGGTAAGGGGMSAILEAVVRNTTPTIRPEDLLTALSEIADLDVPTPAIATRVAQGVVGDDGSVTDPLAQERG